MSTTPTEQLSAPATGLTAAARCAHSGRVSTLPADAAPALVPTPPSGGRLAGKRVLLTGTAGGQGEAAQAAFVREGARVAGCDVQDGAAEGAARGVRVNAISPGFVTSPATDRFVGEELRDFQMGMHLIRRPGTGIDVAALAVYLASDESLWVTGQNISIDGGVTAGFR